MLSLYRWLGSDPEVTEGGGLSLAPRVPSGEGAGLDLMGPAPEVVEAVCNGAVQLAQLALAVATWRLSRPRAPQVRIERDGVTVTVEGAGTEAVERVLRALEAPGGEASAEPAPEPGADPARSPDPGAGTTPGSRATPE
ncbi:hypothetical protein HUT18_26290 [Streptomyces sp. NA04227]|nr:hypothetical protein HUT18_26290 [Streptomyces sp. NA04227]